MFAFILVRTIYVLEQAFKIGSVLIALLFSVLCPAQEYFTYHYQWRAAKFRPPMLSAQGLWAGGIFIVPHLLWHGASVFPVSSEGPPHSIASFDSQGDAEDLFLPWSSFSRVLRHARRCWGSILTRILAEKIGSVGWYHFNKRTPYKCVFSSFHLMTSVGIYLWVHFIHGQGDVINVKVTN
jgi:hypothetical protein